MFTNYRIIKSKDVTILILIDGFLQFKVEKVVGYYNQVTILILIDGFLQYQRKSKMNKYPSSHNPYFNRWFSAISKRYRGYNIR